MKLKIRNLDWLAGRPVVFLNEKTAKKLNIFVNKRVELKGTKKVQAVVDIFSKVVGKKEIGLSKELTKILEMKDNSLVDIRPTEISKAAFLIKKKMQGKELTKQEIDLIISEIVHNNLTDAEIAYFTAAEKLRKMSMKETINLTKAMVKTGAKLKFNGKIIADKHCIGGVAGNRTTPIIISICAAAGLTIPKTSSRAITSAAGTSDVIEVVAKVELSLKRIKDVVRKTGACMVWGGSLGLAPSDDKIIRVERLLNLDIEAQLLASILSKKLSAGSKYIIIDIPYGKNSKIPSLKKAKRLKRNFEKIAKHFKLKLKVLLTDGRKPVGNGFGPVLEMHDIIKVLKNYPDAPTDLKEKSLFLSTELLKLCKLKNARKKAEDILYSGKAYEKFKEIVNAQNQKKNFEKIYESLATAKFKKTIKARKSGTIKEISNKGINSICRMVGTPETITAGAYLHKKSGIIKKGEKLLTIYAENKQKLKTAIKFYKEFKPIIIK